MTRPRREPDDPVVQLRSDVDEIAAELALRRNLEALLPWCVRVRRPGIPAPRPPVERLPEETR